MKEGSAMTRDLHKSTIRLPSDSIRGSVENPGYLVSRTDDGDDAVRLDRNIIIIGNDDTAEVEISGRRIAPYHAEIACDRGNYTLRHCDGREKVKVNGKVVTEHVLNDGDVIAIGDHWFTFRHNQDTPANA
jgi:pSer/pThr/pTyr-binding forkhead associated (FHA) protein